ncbi:MAG: MFS transporter, partial [Planctomycetes bacterium]|nr:MFS transporter [Planctomycetota bacterium]
YPLNRVSPALRPSAIWFLTYAANMAVWTFVPILAREELGIGNTSIGIAVVLYSTALLLASYVFGRASDVYGRRKFIFGGLFVSAFAMAVHFLIADIPSLWMIRFATGFATGIFPAAMVDYIARSSGLLGRFSAWGSLGWGIGALSAGILAAYFEDLTWAFLLAAGIYFAAFLIALTPPKVEQVKMRVPLFPKELIKRNLHYYLPLLVRHAGAMAIWTFWPLYLLDLGADYIWIGIIQFVNPLVQFVFMWLVTDKIRTTLLFPVGLVLSALTFITFTLAENVWQLLPTQILLGISWGCTYVGALRAVTESSEEKATAAGIFNSTTSMSAILGPLFATVIVGFSGLYESTMFFAAFMAVISLILYYVLRRRVEASPQVSASV